MYFTYFVTQSERDEKGNHHAAKIYDGNWSYAGVGAAATAVYAAAANQEFYGGKVIRIIVGFSAGGGFDTYARSLSRYMGKYIPGNPTIIVENMPGAGSLISANYIYRVTKADG